MVNNLYLSGIAKSLQLEQYLKTDHSQDFLLPLFSIKGSTSKKISYTYKNFSDILEAIIGDIFLNSEVLDSVQEFLKQTLNLYGSESQHFLEKVILKDEARKKEYVKVFGNKHNLFLEWVGYSHPDRFSELQGTQKEIVRMVEKEKFLQKLKSQKASSKSFFIYFKPPSNISANEKTLQDYLLAFLNSIRRKNESPFENNFEEQHHVYSKDPSLSPST